MPTSARTAAADAPAGPRGDKPYVVVYPMTKKRSWYVLPHEERARIMAAHFAVGHRYPTIRIHTGYSFGIDDQEFVVAFECDDVRDFLGHANITTTSRYLRSTPLRLERALAAMDAAFAQDSHNAGESVSIGVLKQPPSIADNAVIQ